MTPEEMRQKSAELEAKAEKAFDQGDDEKGVRLVGLAAELLGMADTKERLAKRGQSGKTKAMVTAARVRISGGRGAQEAGAKKTDALLEAANKKHYTLRSLAEELGVSHALLSQARSGKMPIRRKLAEAIEGLIGFKATPANWPGGWSGE